MWKMLKLIIIYTFTVCVCVSSVPVFKDKVTLEKLSTLYLPDSYDTDGTPLYKYSSGAIEQTSYDPDNKLVYAVGRYTCVINIVFVYLLIVINFLNFYYIILIFPKKLIDII